MKRNEVIFLNGCEDKGPGKIVKLLSDAIEKRINSDFKSLNLTLQQLKVILYLRSQKDKEAKSQKDIQEFLLVTHPTVVGIIKSLEAKNFVNSYVSSEDKRVKMIRLNDIASAEEEKKIKKMRKKFHEDLTRGIEKDEMEIFIKCAKKMYENIK